MRKLFDYRSDPLDSKIQWPADLASFKTAPISEPVTFVDHDLMKAVQAYLSSLRNVMNYYVYTFRTSHFLNQ